MAKLPTETDPRLLTEIQRIQRESQTVGHRQFKTKPQVKEIPEGGFVIGVDGGTKFIYTKINGVRHKVALAPDP